MVAVTVFTIVGNAIVLAALRRAERIPAHYPLASIAIADLLVGAFVMPIGAARELFAIHINWVICSLWSTLNVLCCTASILSLCALGWEQWSGVAAPFLSDKRARQARLYSILVWPVATVVALPTAFVPSPKHFHAGELAKTCTINVNVGYVFFNTTFSFYLPTSAMMMIYYVKILLELASLPIIRAHMGRSTTKPEPTKPKPFRAILIETTPVETTFVKATPVETIKGQKTITLTRARYRTETAWRSTAPPAWPPNETSFSSNLSSQRLRRATCTIVMLMSLFLICWTPYFVMLPLDLMCECVQDMPWEWWSWLGFANSALNPLAHAAAAPSVRRAIYDTFVPSRLTREISPRVGRTSTF